MAVKLFVLKPNEFLAYLCLKCNFAFINLEKTMVKVSAVYLGFLLPQRSTTIFGSDENQCHRKLETTNKDTYEDHASVNHYKEKSLRVIREIVLQ